MNTKSYMQYDSKKKSKTTAYILGFLSFIIPVGLHKWYLGQKEWGALYVALTLMTLLYMHNYFGILCSVVHSLLLLVDAVKTSMDVDKYNSELIEGLDNV